MDVDVDDFDGSDQEESRPIPSVDKAKGRAPRSPSPTSHPDRPNSPPLHHDDDLFTPRPDRSRVLQERDNEMDVDFEGSDRQESLPIPSVDKGKGRAPRSPSPTKPSSPNRSPSPSPSRRKLSPAERERIDDLTVSIIGLAEELHLSPMELLKEGGFGISVAQVKPNPWNVFQKLLRARPGTPKNSKLLVDSVVLCSRSIYD